MKSFLLVFLIALLGGGCTSDTNSDSNHADHQHESTSSENTEKKPSLSPHTNAMAMIGDAHVHIDYSSPRVRDRIIWGGLVAYGDVWVTGAHNATWIQTNKDLMLNGQHLSAGKYALFTIPGKEEWTVIINKNWEQHGKDEYDQADDVMRFSVVPEILEESVEELTYKVVGSDDNNGIISMAWDKVKISFSFEIH